MKKIKILLMLLALLVFCSAGRAELNMSSAASMGMGNCGLAIIDGLDSVFLNPAGLSKVDRWGVTSLYTKRLDEVNYLVAGLAVPVQYGTIGVSLTGSQINDIPLTTMINGDLDQQNISFATAGSYILGLAYGFDLGPSELGLSSGIKLKYFTQDLIKGSANGYDLDLGVRYQPVNWFRLALVEENALPSSLGASLNWSTGLKEPLDARTKLAAGLWNEESGLGLEGGIERSTMKNEPFLYRAGLEWWPVNILAFRAGFDQELAPTGGGQSPEIYNDYSLGVGFRLAGFQFDYAYKTYAGYSSNTAHFFSVSFLGRNDFLPPQLETRLVSNQVKRSETLKLGIRSSEKLASLMAVLPGGEEAQLQLNEKNMVLLEWQVPENAFFGYQEVSFKAVDLDGNKTSQSVGFEILPRQPQITALNLAKRQATTEAEIIIKGEVFGEELLVNSTVIPLNDGAFKTVVGLKPGVNRLKMTVKGEGGLDKDEEYVVLRKVVGIKKQKGENDVKN